MQIRKPNGEKDSQKPTYHWSEKLVKVFVNGWLLHSINRARVFHYEANGSVRKEEYVRVKLFLFFPKKKATFIGVVLLERLVVTQSLYIIASVIERLRIDWELNYVFKMAD